MKALERTRQGGVEGALIATTVGDVVYDQLELGQDLGLAEGKFGVPLFVIEGYDHVLDLWETWRDEEECRPKRGL